MQVSLLQRFCLKPALLNLPYRSFGASQKLIYGTDTPAKSGKYQKGLFHLKTHGQRRQRCFSMKYSLITMKPNTMRKNFFSDVLGMNFQLWISMHARRCIMKAGSFDNYLLETKPKYIDSRMGLHLRSLMKQKQKDPEFEIPYIPGQASRPRSRVTKTWMHRQIPAVYMPLHVRMQDQSEFYLKTPQEMSRYEIADLEKELRAINDPDMEEDAAGSADTEEDMADPTAKYHHMPDYWKYRESLAKFLPVRNGVLKRYFDKYKFQKSKREEVLRAADESEKFVKGIMGTDYVHYWDMIPEIRQFMQQIEIKEAAKTEKIEQGKKTVDSGKFTHVLRQLDEKFVKDNSQRGTNFESAFK